jgi:hypothetical protein
MDRQAADGLGEVRGGIEEGGAMQDAPNGLVIDAQVIRAGQVTPMAGQAQPQDKQEMRDTHAQQYSRRGAAWKLD